MAPKPAIGAHWFQTTVTCIKERIACRDEKKHWEGGSRGKIVILSASTSTQTLTTKQAKNNTVDNLAINIFVNDIDDIFDSTCDPLIMRECKISCLQYADDLILLSESEHGL